MTAPSIISSQLQAKLTEACAGDIEFDFPLSRRTTLKIGGPADALATPTSQDSLRRVIDVALDHKLPILPLGGGSNLLVRDGGIRGLVLSTRKLRAVERVEETKIRVECGASTGRVLSLATKWQLGGVEFLGGVPGTVGGGMIMNAGTYLGEFKDVTESVTLMDLTSGETVMRSNDECGFVYRGSAIPKTELVCEALLALTPRSRQDIGADVAGLRKRRKEREPTGVHNSGSTFKNPPGDYAGRLIEAAGLKGTSVGGALCSPTHANWLVNTGDATARDMIELIDMVKQKVSELHGVQLVLEVKIVGEDL